MQHAIVAETPATSPNTGASGAASSNAFVINLMSSTTPVALTRPDHAGLKRFTFFVSRRREDGRERFRLHMGYFDSQQEAEQLLDIVRAFYPGAWVGLAPGRRLSAASAAVPVAAPAAAPTVSFAAVAPAPAAPAPDPTAAAPPVAAATPAEPTVPVATGPAPALATSAATSEPAAPSVPTLALLPDTGRPILLDVADRGAAHLPAAEGAKDDAHEAARSLSNVREAIAALGDGPPAAAMIPTVHPLPVLSDTATLRLLESGAQNRVAACAPKGAAQPVADTVVQRLPQVPDTVVQRVAAVASHAHESTGQTDEDTRETTSAARGEKPWYAVQLLWSVQPIDIAQIPQLAIFSAYTLYGAEGNRDGRRWYGLRLGFFADAVSAKQVAHYVRSDFATVSVVPVTEREREQAKVAVSRSGDTQIAASAAPGKRQQSGVARPRIERAPSAGSPVKAAAAAKAGKPARQDGEFKFIDDLPPAKAAAPGNETATRTTAASQPPRAGASRPPRGAPGKRAKLRPPGQIHGRAQAKPKTLEETLEILGANQLQVDNESGATINDSGVRHVRIEIDKGKPSKLSRLIERLSERRG